MSTTTELHKAQTRVRELSAAVEQIIDAFDGEAYADGDRRAQALDNLRSVHHDWHDDHEHDCDAHLTDNVHDCTCDGSPVLVRGGWTARA